jgi:hypothetical protein
LQSLPEFGCDRYVEIGASINAHGFAFRGFKK